MLGWRDKTEEIFRNITASGNCPEMLQAITGEDVSFLHLKG